MMEALEFIDQLKLIHAPSKIQISHNLIGKLIDQFTKTDTKIDSHLVLALIQQIKSFIKEEEKFLIGKREYEKKEQRFLSYTYYPEEKLEQKYINQNLIFVDINPSNLVSAIKTNDLQKIKNELAINETLIENDLSYCYTRINLLKRIWRDISNQLEEKFRLFEQRGVKLISNNLRLKLIPEIKELKSSLSSELVEDAISRRIIADKLEEMLKNAKEDLFGDLSESQILMYERIGLDITIHETLDLLTNENQRNDLLELIKTGKVRLEFKKLFDQLI